MPPLTDLDAADFLRLVDRRRANTALLTYRPGMVLPGQSFTRSTTATYVDASGIVQTAAVNTLRSGHYIGGVQSILLEGTRTNSCLNSTDLSAASWAGAAATTPNAVGLNGSANSCCTVTDADAASFQSRAQTIAVANDNAVHAAQFWVRKDSNQARFPQFKLGLSGGTAQQAGASLNTQTGAFVVANAIGVNTARVVDAGLWWVVELTITNNTTLNTTLTALVYPAARSSLAGADDVAATGSVVIGHVQVELNSAFMSSPIFTTTVAVTRGADSLSFPFTTAPQAMTVYTQHVELGTVNVVNSGLWAITNAAGATPRLYTITNGTKYAVQLGAPGTSISGVPAVAPILGDTVETLGILSSAADASIQQSLNGGAASSAGPGATVAMPTAWGAPAALYLNHNALINDGFAAFSAVKIAAGNRSLAAMRSL